MVAAATALGVAELVAVTTSPRSTPLVAVSGVVIDNVPEGTKSLAIRLFGVHDKQALLIGTTLLLALFAAGIGVLAISRPRWGTAGIGAFAAIGMAAALTRSGATAGWAVPSLVGGTAGAWVLWYLGRFLPGEPAEPASAEPASTEPTPAQATLTDATPADAPPAQATPSVQPVEAGPDRRRFLKVVAATVAGAAIVGTFGRSLAQRRNVSGARQSVVLPTPSGPPATAPAGAELSVPGLATYTTSNERFYRIDTAVVVPQIDPETWALRIRGRVRNPIMLTFEDLLRRPMIERYVTLACVSNEVGGDLIGNARWLGVPVKDLLDEADPELGADQVVSRSVDGFTAGTPTAVLRDGRDAMIAIGMNGAPLPVEHGFPARMVVPGLYGYVSATKWLAELELTSFADFDAYWVPRGWAPRAPIKTQSRIDVPRRRATIPAGPVTVAGVAWAQHRGISAVEVRADDGPWLPATLAETASVDTWRQWLWRWDATPGQHRLQVRATDRDGQVQTEQDAPPAPNGATGYHTIQVTAA
ncbi:MAG: molybdopterin-dependent oxidoreductase [Micromonosporaceae bacterium]